MVVTVMVTMTVTVATAVSPTVVHGRRCHHDRRGVINRSRRTVIHRRWRRNIDRLRCVVGRRRPIVVRLR